MELNGQELIAKVNTNEHFEHGLDLEMMFDCSDLHFFDKQTTARIETGPLEEKGGVN